MKVLVPVKRVVDYNVKVRVKPDNTGVDLSNVKMSVNPFCEIAIEEAVRLKEAGIATEVIAVAVGASACQEQLRTCLALGADRAVLIETDEDVQPLGIARALQALQESRSGRSGTERIRKTAAREAEVARGTPGKRGLPENPNSPSSCRNGTLHPDLEHTEDHHGGPENLQVP